MVRVISGKLRGKKLVVPQGGKDVRPTLDRVKESVFNILAGEIKKHIFLDLFAGAGSMGIEALSRGAPLAIFVEQDTCNIKNISANLQSCRLSDTARLYQGDVLSVLSTLPSDFPNSDFLVYADPPFESNLFEKILKSKALQKLVKRKGRVLIEHPFKIDIAHQSQWENVRKKKYGSVGISFFEKT